ncbi:Uncharacterised protein [Vibrio cholerae]|nr:Uncharacterised protein [Vibrio cholerae]
MAKSVSLIRLLDAFTFSLMLSKLLIAWLNRFWNAPSSARWLSTYFKAASTIATLSCAPPTVVTSRVSTVTSCAAPIPNSPASAPPKVAAPSIRLLSVNSCNLPSSSTDALIMSV